MDFAERIIAYMKQKNYKIFTNPGEMNMVYVEGVDLKGQVIEDKWDEFNDPRIIISFVDGKPKIVHICEATCEPGKKPTFSKEALGRGGVFRIAFGQYFECFQMSFHKGKDWHPALCQIWNSKIYGYRDANKDGKRTGDKYSLGYGINNHGTSPWYLKLLVSDFSEGCCVARIWADHIESMNWMKKDPRYVANSKFKYTTTVIPGDDLQKQFPWK